jgi:hypothetical protein
LHLPRSLPHVRPCDQASGEDACGHVCAPCLPVLFGSHVTVTDSDVCLSVCAHVWCGREEEEESSFGVKLLLHRDVKEVIYVIRQNTWRWTNWIDTNARQPWYIRNLCHKFWHRGSSGMPTQGVNTVASGRARRPEPAGPTRHTSGPHDLRGQAFECGG